jgi:hypothetical protein
MTKHSAPNERPWVGRLAENRYSALSCGETQAEAIANARLIAAAPELYEALKTMRDYVADVASGALKLEGSGDGLIAMAKEDLTRLDAALRRANGDVA